MDAYSLQSGQRDSSYSARSEKLTLNVPLTTLALGIGSLTGTYYGMTLENFEDLNSVTAAAVTMNLSGMLLAYTAHRAFSKNRSFSLRATMQNSVVQFAALGTYFGIERFL